LKTRTVVRRAAELDLEGIEDWYESGQPGLGAEFRGAFEALMSTIREHPSAFPERYRGNRRALMKRFPYVVWYRLEGDTAIVLACIHGSRDPRIARARAKAVP
jgi:plasmid stabilization system protein ParE